MHHGALKYSSDWKLFHCEIQRIRKGLVDNDYAQKIKAIRVLPAAQAFNMFPTCSKPSDGETTGCQASYFGFTSCRLNRRIRGLRNTKSAIYKHLYTDNLAPMYPVSKFVSNVRILCKTYHDIAKIKLAEALLIRTFNPHINVKFNEMFNF